MKEHSETKAILADGLTKSYGARVALDSVDLDVAAGTVLGLLGANGAGKTTLIRILTTVLSADAGSFSIDGIPNRDQQAIRSCVGLLPESAGLPANETGAEVLTFHGRLFGLSPADARRRSLEVLEIVGLAERAGSLVSGYSRGMRQRLGIARALVNTPRVVFLDEPTLGLDPGGQKQVLDHISYVARQHGTSVVLSTHVLAEVEQICDRVIILNAGRVVADGRVEDVARQAAAPRRGRLSVPPERVSTALEVLGALRIVERVGDGSSGGELDFELRSGVTRERGAEEVLVALVGTGIPVLAFELERGRLSDAFLELTAAS